jgi:hypothetical protein
MGRLFLFFFLFCAFVFGVHGGDLAELLPAFERGTSMLRDPGEVI